jgi:transposase InsO family protein
LVGLARSSHRCKSTKDEQAALRMRLKELAAIQVHYGYRCLHILLRREGWDVNAKRIYRLYREEQLSLRTKTPRRRVSCRTRVDRPDATHINDCWAIGFMSDELFDGRHIRLLTIVDHFTRESLDCGRKAIGSRGRDKPFSRSYPDHLSHGDCADACCHRIGRSDDGTNASENDPRG